MNPLVNQEHFLKFHGTSEVSSHNGLLRFLATIGASEGVVTPIGNKSKAATAPALAEPAEIATANFREFFFLFYALW